MQQATTLSPADRTAVEVSLARMAGNAFGSLATLPLYCLGELPSSSPRTVVLEHYEVWHSCLIVVREVLKADGGAQDTAHAWVAALIDAVADLRNSYLQIHDSYRSAPALARVAYERVVGIYERLPELIHELGNALELEVSFLPEPRSLKKASYDRSLRAFGEAIADGGRNAPAIEG